MLVLLVTVHLVLCSLRLSAGLGNGEVTVDATVAVFARVGHFLSAAFPEKSFLSNR